MEETPLKWSLPLAGEFGNSQVDIIHLKRLKADRKRVKLGI